MLVGPWLGWILCALAGVARPIVAAHHAVHSPEASARWLAFFACAALLVLPLAALPAWLPLRHEAMLTLLLLLGAGDARGADALHRRYVAPLLGELLRPLHAATQLTADTVLDAVEQRVAARATAEEDPQEDLPDDPPPEAAEPSSDGTVVLEAESEEDPEDEKRVTRGARRATP